MAKIEDVTFTGASGRRYQFGAYPWGADFKELGAVYVVTRRSAGVLGGSSYAPLYIGQTSDLSERFDNHHKASCFVRNGVNSICVYVEGAESTRLGIERDLLGSHQTPCNG